MWDKHFRLSLVFALYQKLFWSDLGFDEFEVDFDYIISNLHLAEEVAIDKDLLKKELDKGLEKAEESGDYLKKYLNNWEKTYKLVQAILFAFLLEKKTAKDDVGSIVGKYIRITQDFVGGKNTALVHAVTSKIVESK